MKPDFRCAGCNASIEPPSIDALEEYVQVHGTKEQTVDLLCHPCFLKFYEKLKVKHPDIAARYTEEDLK